MRQRGDISSMSQVIIKNKTKCFKIASKWGILFTVIIHAPLLVTIFWAEHLSDKYGMSTNVHDAFFGLFVSWLVVGFCAYISSISLIFKRPSSGRGLLIYSLIHGAGWYFLFKIVWILTTPLITRELVLPSRSINILIELGIILVLVFTAWCLLKFVNNRIYTSK
jgi:hypothetical protein